MTAYDPYAAPQPNPYAAPQASPQAPAYGPAWAAERYTPLGWRTVAAALFIGATSVLSFAVDGSQIAFGDRIAGDDPDVAAALVIAASGAGVIITMILAAVFFGIWIHRAARNLRGLGRYGMEYSPGACVGWFYVPFVNLVRPVKAVSELWRASDPDGDGNAWSMASSTPLLGVWWGTWLVGNLVANVSARIDDPGTSGGVGLVGSALTAVAAVSIVALMRSISARQDAAAARLSVRA